MQLHASTLAALGPAVALNRAITERCNVLNRADVNGPLAAAAIEKRAASLRTYYVASDGYVTQRKALAESKHGPVVYTLRAVDTADAAAKAQRAHAAGRFTYRLHKEA